MNNHEIGYILENYVVNCFVSIGVKAKKTKGSGNKGQLGDIQQDFFVVECKKRNTKDITIKEDVWKKLNNEIPLHSSRIPLYALENVNGVRLAVLNLDDFIKIFEGYIKNG